LCSKNCGSEVFSEFSPIGGVYIYETHPTMTLPPDRFQEIVNVHAAPLTLYARQFFEQYDFHAAEEVVQDVLFRLSQQPNEPKHLAAWLYKSVRNGAIAAERSLKRRKHRESNWVPFFKPSEENQPDAERISQVLQELESPYREIVVLYIWGNHSFKEIASLLDLPMTTVFRKYQEALDMLREFLSTD
jgi:RNA polymerase sigma-70 factor (ECF subfamily)